MLARGFCQQSFRTASGATAAWQQSARSGAGALASQADSLATAAASLEPLAESASDEADLPDASKLLESCLRASLASEALATKLFTGQRRIMRSRPDLALMQENEQEHLNKLRKLAPEYRTRPSLLAPALGALGSALGMAAAAAPSEIYGAITGGAQEALTEHYNDQLRDLRAAGVSEAASEFRDVLRDVRDEERAPANHAQVPDVMALRNMENITVSEGIAGVVKYSVKGLLGLTYRV